MVKYEMKRGLITELIMLDNITNNNINEFLESEGGGTRTHSRARTPSNNNNILAMSKSQASSLCMNNLPSSKPPKIVGPLIKKMFNKPPLKN
jgi:hypothetical protein